MQWMYVQVLITIPLISPFFLYLLMSSLDFTNLTSYLGILFSYTILATTTLHLIYQWSLENELPLCSKSVHGLLWQRGSNGKGKEPRA